MHLFKLIARRIIRISFNASVALINRLSNMERYRSQVNQLRKLPDGTLGKEIANCLDMHNLCLVPGFESHDMKHVLLGYEMTPEDEIRMQAFMIGNGNYSFPSLAIFLFGAVLLPDLWSVFLTDFKKGASTIPVSAWTIEDYAEYSLDDLREQLAQSKKMTLQPSFAHHFTRLAALLTIAAGVFGMLFCLPFLFSANIVDLIGAGFPFVAGAILVVGGLFSLANLTARQRELQQIEAMLANLKR
ncbi:MAG: hypothetical protein AAF705_08295 [Bacteroidota bacterium]